MRTVVTGATGLLGEEVADWLAGQEGHELIGLCGRRDLDVVDTRAVVSFMCRAQPDLIVHCAAERDMDAAERDPKAAYMLNTFGTWNLALAARLCDCKMVFISSEAVYSGEKDAPYTESDLAAPLSVYGWSKLAAEEEVKSLLERYFILRVPLLFGAKGHSDNNRILNFVRALRSGKCVTAPIDQWTSPTYARDVAMAIGCMTRSWAGGRRVSCCFSNGSSERTRAQSEYGVYVVANQGKASRYEFACKLAELASCDGSLVRPGSREGKPARRTKNTTLDCARLKRDFGFALRPWEDALSECVQSMGLFSQNTLRQL
ncbi:MAG TPA: NAD(P)-dependent oxidoreductase [Bacillota bacterium]|nr:NAD(P)-dependent oxidoreductase [Bacillota bacterium]